MVRLTSGRETAIETFANHTEMSEREAEAFVLRELMGIRRGEVADMMEISESTLDNHVQSAKQKARLPHIDHVKRVSAKNTGYEEGESYEIWFENGALLRYVWNEELGQIKEETATAADAHSIHESMAIGGSEDELAEYTLESLEEYTRTYREDWKACRQDWGPVFEAITCW